MSALPSEVRIDVRLPDTLPPVRVDRTLMARALTNLIENALQAMPSGGTFTVAGARDAQHVRLELRDTGVGMDDENVRRAFEPYFSTKTAGSGLGLANARRNIELCGGTISLSSTPGAGTSVTLTLPTETPAGAASD
jgi:signal transduction histidine kinase